MQNYITGKYRWTSSTLGFNFIRLNTMYTIPNFYRTHFSYDHAIVPKLCYQKWRIICSLISVGSFIFNCSIFDLIVVIYSFANFVDVICIYLWLLFWCNNDQYAICSMGRVISRQNTNWTVSMIDHCSSSSI